MTSKIEIGERFKAFKRANAVTSQTEMGRMMGWSSSKQGQIERGDFTMSVEDFIWHIRVKLAAEAKPDPRVKQMRNEIADYLEGVTDEIPILGEPAHAPEMGQKRANDGAPIGAHLSHLKNSTEMESVDKWRSQQEALHSKAGANPQAATIAQSIVDSIAVYEIVIPLSGVYLRRVDETQKSPITHKAETEL